MKNDSPAGQSHPTQRVTAEYCAFLSRAQSCNVFNNKDTRNAQPLIIHDGVENR